MKILHLQNQDMRKLSWTYANILRGDYLMSPFFWFSTVMVGPTTKLPITKSTLNLAFQNLV